MTASDALYQTSPAMSGTRDGIADALEPATEPETRGILLVLPDLEFGGGQLNAIRLANALTRTHRVFILNARPKLYDAQVANSLCADVVPLEGTLHDLPRYDAS